MPGGKDEKDSLGKGLSYNGPVRFTVTNSGDLPAVGAAVLRPGRLDTFTADDNYFWLDAGESKAVAVSETDGLIADAWNAERVLCFSS